jgi:hypothetical protein
MKKINFLKIIFLFSSLSLYSQNGGWEFVGLDGKTVGAVVIDNNRIFFSIAYDGLRLPYKSTDLGNTWEQISNGFEVIGYQYYANSIFVDADDNLFTCGLGGMFKSTNSGDLWLQIGEEIPTEEFYTLSGLSNGNILVSCFAGLYYSTNNGEDWLETNLIGYNGISAIEEHTNGIILAGSMTATGRGIYRSSDFGINWTRLNLYPTLTICSYGSTLIFAGVNDGEPEFSGIYRSSDAGLTWDRINSIISQHITYDYDLQKLWMVEWDGEGGNDVYFSIDTATVWQHTNLNLIESANGLYYDDDEAFIYAGTDNGLYRINSGYTPVELLSFTAAIRDNKVFLSWTTATETNNKGFNVERFSKSLNNGWETIGFVAGNGTTTQANSYTYTEDNLKNGRYKYRLKQIDFDGSFEYSKEIVIELNISFSFELAQNYPNPYSKSSGGNPTTVIKFSIPNIVGDAKFASPTANVTLKVYDVLGKEVATLVNKKLSAGEYEVKFDGNGLPSGVYYYRLQAGNFAETKKMIILK